MKYWGFLSILLIFTLHSSYGQRQIEGTISNEKNVPLSNASLFCIDTSGKIIAHTTSGKTGRYTLQIPEDTRYAEISVTHIGYTRQVVFYNRSQNKYNFKLAASDRELPEVTVKSDKFITINNDTINYNVKKFASAADETIGDVLKKIPGIKINKDGGISYNGVPINKFYIDGMDLLGDKYNIAETTVPYGIVDKVQVLENHQPINMLRGVENTEKPAINLKLSDSARWKIMGKAEARWGSPITLHDQNAVTANTMTFSNGFQYINKLGYDATGQNLSFDTKQHISKETLDQQKNELPYLVDVSSISNPQTEEARWRFNNSGLATLNNLVRLKKDAQLRINVDFLPEQTEMNYTGETGIILNQDSTVLQREQRKEYIRSNKFSLQMNYELNNDKYYSSNNLSFHTEAVNTHSDITYEQGYTSQYLKNHSLSLKDRLYFVKRVGKDLFLKFRQDVGFISAPQDLTLQPGIILTDSVMDLYQTIQSLKQRIFYSDSRASTEFVLRKFVLLIDAGLDIRHDRYQSDLTQYNGSNMFTEYDQWQSNATWNSFNFYLRPTLSYKNNKWVLSLAMPLSYNVFRFKERLRTYERNNDLFNALPQFSTMYNINQRNKITLGINKHKNWGSPQYMLPAMIMLNYRNTLYSETPLGEISYMSCYIGYNYKKSMEGITASASLSASRNTSNTMNNVSYLASGLMRTSPIEIKNTSNNYMLLLYFSKYFFKSLTALNVNINGSLNNLPTLQNDILSRIQSKSITSSISVSTSHFNKFDVSNVTTWSYSNSLLKNQSTVKNGVWTIKESAQISYQYNKFLQASYNCEYQNIRSKYGNNGLLMNNVKITYNYGRHSNKISFGISNIGNIRIYNYKSLMNNTISQSQYLLRPRSFYLGYSIRF